MGFESAQCKLTGCDDEAARAGAHEREWSRGEGVSVGWKDEFGLAQHFGLLQRWRTATFFTKLQNFIVRFASSAKMPPPPGYV